MISSRTRQLRQHGNPRASLLTLYSKMGFRATAKKVQKTKYKKTDRINRIYRIKKKINLIKSC